MKRLILYQTRLTGRRLWPEMRANLEIPWTASVADFCIAVHGEHLPQEEATLFGDSGHPIKDYCGKTDGFLPGMLEYLFHDFLIGRHEIIGVMDDDAVYECPFTMAKRVLELFDADESVGVVGPVSKFYQHWKYNDELAVHDAREIDSCPWATFGSTFIHRRVLTTIDWAELFKHTRYWWDFTFNMEAHRRGFKLLDVVFPYKHRGVKGTGKGEPYKAKRALDALTKQLAWTEQWFAGTPYAKPARTMIRNHIRNRLMPRIEVQGTL